MRKQLKRFFAFVLALAMIVGDMPMSTVEVQAASKVSVKSLKLNKTQYVLKKGKTVKSLSEHR